jgi:hypothetical protein
MIRMGSVLFDETAIERHTADAIREEIGQRLASGEWPVELVAERLGLVPVGVDAVLHRRWTFEEAFRIAMALGIDFGSKLSELGNQPI